MTHRLALPLIVLVPFVGCGEGTSVPETPAYLASLPRWESFAPPTLPLETEGLETPAGPAEIFETLAGNQVLLCETRPMSFHKTPGEYAMFSPPLDLLYPGALIQGRSLRDGAQPADLLPLNISERAEVMITIPACLTNDNSRQVAPTLAAVNQAISSIVASAIDQELDCVNAIGELKQETYRNEQHKALSIGVSGKYFGFSAHADTSVEQTSNENALSVTFIEQLYKVQYQAPQTPGEIFSEDFSAERLQEQIDLGRLGPDNLPVYVAEVTYGRLMNFTMVSSASETDMRAAVSAKYSNPLGNSVEGSITAEQETLLQQARYSVAYLGGSAEANAAMLSSLRWGDYFGKKVEVGDAVPISFTLRNLSDNSVAAVQELTTYDITTCTQKLADGATFDLREEQTLQSQLPPGSGQLTRIGYIDDDRFADLVWVSPALDDRGQFQVAYGRGDGTFLDPVLVEHPAASTASGEFSAHVADVDADGRDDILLVLRSVEGVRAYVSFWRDGGFVHSAEQSLYGPGDWLRYTVRTAQLDGRDGVDLFLNTVPTWQNWTYIAHARPPGGLDIESDALFTMTGVLKHPVGGFTAYHYVYVADFDGDGRDDIGWQRLNEGEGNPLHFARGTENGLSFEAFVGQGSRWGVYTGHAGDVNGDGRADLVMPRTRSRFEDYFIYTRSGQSRAPYFGPPRGLSIEPERDINLKEVLGDSNPGHTPHTQLEDVDGDGRADLVLNDLGGSEALTNRIVTGLGRSDGSFSFARIAQTHPRAIDWSGFEVHYADLDGDGRTDVIWVRTGPENRVFVGMARGG